MKNFRYAVNRFFQLPEPARFAESLATAGSPASRAPFSEARKGEILATRTPPCKRYFDRPGLRQNGARTTTKPDTQQGQKEPKTHIPLTASKALSHNHVLKHHPFDNT